MTIGSRSGRLALVFAVVWLGIAAWVLVPLIQQRSGVERELANLVEVERSIGAEVTELEKLVPEYDFNSDGDEAALARINAQRKVSSAYDAAEQARIARTVGKTMSEILSRKILVALSWLFGLPLILSGIYFVGRWVLKGNARQEA